MCFTILTPIAMAEEQPKLKLSATITFDGSSPELQEDYLIKLSAIELNNPMPKGSFDGVYTMIVKEAGTVTFPEITYSQVGIYQYTIQQEMGLNPEVIYDATQYHLTVVVSNTQAGGLEIAVVAKKDGEVKKPDELIFSNSFLDRATVQFRALKTLDGRTPDDGAFFFHLKNEEGELLQTKANLGRGVVFDEVQLYESGTYIFYISEKNEINPLIKYDETIYTATVNVIEKDNGGYKTSVSYKKKEESYEGIPSFKNLTRIDIPDAGVSESALPVIGVTMLLLGVALMLRRRKMNRF